MEFLSTLVCVLTVAISASIVTIVQCQNVALNKQTYMPAQSGYSDGMKTVDGSSEEFGVMNVWMVVDLGRDYLVEIVTIDYLSWGWANVQAEVFLANPITFAEAQSSLCEKEGQAASHNRHTMTLVCPPDLYGRYVRVRRSNVNHPYFRVYELEVHGSIPDIGILAVLERPVPLYASYRLGDIDDCQFPAWQSLLESHANVDVARQLHEQTINGMRPCSRPARSVTRQTGSRLITSSSSTTHLSAISTVDCACQCYRHPGCQGFNFNHVTTDCETLMVTGFVGIDDNVTNNVDWQMFYLQ